MFAEHMICLSANPLAYPRTDYLWPPRKSYTIVLQKMIWDANRRLMTDDRSDAMLVGGRWLVVQVRFFF
jgi:hypothetical protein